ncbi:MAG: hypothetical protein M1820_007485 [Bogoriella megaspora]|nr:MAG: hypothetical protein M1820_007485 [Bogoriella megaspora]
MGLLGKIFNPQPQKWVTTYPTPGSVPISMGPNPDLYVRTVQPWHHRLVNKVLPNRKNGSRTETQSPKMKPSDRKSGQRASEPHSKATVNSRRGTDSRAPKPTLRRENAFYLPRDEQTVESEPEKVPSMYRQNTSQARESLSTWYRVYAIPSYAYRNIIATKAQPRESKTEILSPSEIISPFERPQIFETPRTPPPIPARRKKVYLYNCPAEVKIENTKPASLRVHIAPEEEKNLPELEVTCQYLPVPASEIEFFNAKNRALNYVQGRSHSPPRRRNGSRQMHSLYMSHEESAVKSADCIVTPGVEGPEEEVALEVSNDAGSHV